MQYIQSVAVRNSGRALCCFAVVPAPAICSKVKHTVHLEENGYAGETFGPLPPTKAVRIFDQNPF